MNRKHISGKYRCKSCQVGFALYIDYKIHLEEVHDVNNGCVCYVCLAETKQVNSREGKSVVMYVE